jgi:GrpB-like predicted nucleotidyltransferase (UPF0157 family)
MKRPIILTPHDARWVDLFAIERDAILHACGGVIRAVYHVGSTSIPGIAAKPIIDIMPVLARHEHGWACIEAMERLGYESRGEVGIQGRQFFRKGDPRSHHVHMFADGRPEIGRHLRFRDYLRAHPEEARAYEALKQELAARFIDDTRAYSDGKDEFCARIDRLAAGESQGR